MGSFISVVITAFNEEKYLPFCLAALQKQTYSKEQFEIIVVDNNSTDKTSQIAKEFGVKVILEKRQGNTFALKRGMNEAKGDIIAGIDADSQAGQDWLQTIEKAFEGPDVVGVTGSTHLETKSRLLGISMDMMYSILMNIALFIGKPNLSGFNFAVRRSAFHKVGGINESFQMSPDVDLGIRLSKIGKIKVANDLQVATSARRWEKRFFPTMWEYVKGHIYAAWLRKPPPIKQTAVR